MIKIVSHALFRVRGISRGFGLSCTLCMGACGAESSDPVPAEEVVKPPPAEPKVVAKPVPMKVRKKAHKAKGDASAQGKSYRRFLKKGRKQVRAGKVEAGIKTFRGALHLDPNNARLLGELGFAALKLSDYVLARRASRDCVRHSHDLKVSGSCYYNLGRALEAEEDIAGAAEAYRQSLVARPDNKIVKRRLAELGEAAAAKEQEQEAATACGGISCDPAESVEALCERLQARVRSMAGLESEGEEAACEVAARQAVDGERLKEVALLLVEDPDGLGEAWYFLAMKGEGGWVNAGEIGYLYNPGVFGISEEAEVEVSVEDTIPGGDPEVVVELRLTRADTDMDIGEYEFVDRKQRTICELHSKGASCYGPIPLSYSFSREFDPETAEEGVRPDPSLPIQVSYDFEIREPSAGKIEVKLIEHEGKVPEEITSLIDRVYDIREFPGVDLDGFSPSW